MGLPILDILGVVGKVIDNVIPDPDKRMELQLELAKLADNENARESSERIAQAEVNKAEASNSSIFVAGWRPAAGWMSVSCIGYVIVVAPMLHLGVPAPENMTLVRDILLGMLGLSIGARSIEKIKGVAQNTLTGAPNAPIAQVIPEKKKKKILGIAVPPWLK
jgi:hypothetical protein